MVVDPEPTVAESTPAAPNATQGSGADEETQEVSARAGVTSVASPRLTPGRLVVGLFTLAVFLLGIVWAVTSPAPSGTDEPAHYIRALATGRGELLAPHVQFPSRDPTAPDAVFFWDQTTLRFVVPAKQAPASTFACDAGPPFMPATCVLGSRCQRWQAACPDPPTSGDVALPTYLGVYEPTTYAVPGLLAGLGNNDVNGLRWARIGTVLVATLLIGLAAAALWDRRSGAFALLGLLVAVTPMVIYMNGIVNANGGEIVSALCFAAMLVRLWRDGARAPTWVWVVAGVSGGFCAFSRALGPLWVAVHVVTVVAIMGVRPALRTLYEARWWRSGTAVGLTAAGMIADRVWWLFAGSPHSLHPVFANFPKFLPDVAGSLPLLLQQQVGAIGWGEGDVSVGAVTYVIWGLMVVVLLSLALLVGSMRQRVVLLAALAANLAFTVVVGAMMRVAFGFGGTGILGRYVLPWTTGILLIAGEIVRRNRGSLRRGFQPRRLVLGFAVASGVCHIVALYMSARAFGAGLTSPLWFLGHDAWRPPLGWGPWSAVALAAAALLVATGLVAMRAGGGADGSRTGTGGRAASAAG